MTKSRTLRKAGAVVLSLAMAFSVAGVAPSADAAAKKPALSAKKGTITVGNKKTVKVKNTKAKKVKNLVVSSNKTAVATVKKNSKVKFTVTGKKAGTAKITAKVTLKKAVAKKKVYKLKYTATVKAAATPAPDVTATPAELALENVEPAVDGDCYVVIAYFNQAVDTIDPSEVQIRRVSDNQLFSVASVVMASDKKSATMTLTGYNASGANATYLQPNVEYKMIVTKNGKAAEKVFVIPLTLADAIVTGVDESKKQVSIWGNDYTVSEGVTVDYFDVLGRTVTAKVNNKGEIIGLTTASETVVYGAFKYTEKTASKNAVYKEIASEKEYTASSYSEVNTSKYRTSTVALTDKFVGASADGDVDSPSTANVPGTDLAWGKLMLNPDNSIRTIQGIASVPTSAYIKSVSGEIIENGAGTKTNFKDYKIIKDNKLVKASELAAGEIIYYNTTQKLAYVYSTAITGKFEKNYGTKGFVFAGKEYSNNVASLKKADESAYDSDAIDALIKDAKEVSLYAKLDGTPVYVIGEAAALTKDIKLIVTEEGHSGSGSAEINSVKGYNIETKAMESYSWGEASTDTPAVDGTVDEDSVITGIYYAKVTVDAADGKTVKKFKPQDKAFDVSTNNVYLGSSSENGQKLTKSVKNIGKTGNDGMTLSSSKIVVYKAPASGKAKAENFSVADFSSWGGEIVSASDAKTFADTSVYGELSKSVDIITTTQASAGSTGMEAGTAYIGFVTSIKNGSNKKVEVIKKGEAEKAVYETIDSDLNLAGLDEGKFYTVTPSKDGKGLKDLTALSYRVEGDVVTLDAADESAGLTVSSGNYKLSTDYIVIKKDGTSYSEINFTDIDATNIVSIVTEDGNNTKAQAIIVGVAAGVGATRMTAIDKIIAANAAYSTLDSTNNAANWKTYETADTAADAAITAYVNAGGTANASNLTAAYTTFGDNATAAGLLATADKTAVEGTTNGLGTGGAILNHAAYADFDALCTDIVALAANKSVKSITINAAGTGVTVKYYGGAADTSATLANAVTGVSAVTTKNYPDA